MKRASACLNPCACLANRLSRHSRWQQADVSFRDAGYREVPSGDCADERVESYEARNLGLHRLLVQVGHLGGQHLCAAQVVHRHSCIIIASGEFTQEHGKRCIAGGQECASSKGPIALEPQLQGPLAGEVDHLLEQRELVVSTRLVVGNGTIKAGESWHGCCADMGGWWEGGGDGRREGVR